MAGMLERLQDKVQWLFGPGPIGAKGYLNARWLFLRALGLIYFSAFYSLIFQIRGLLGPTGILPAGEYLALVSKYLGAGKFWYAPTVLWLSSSDKALLTLCWTGLIASILVTVNLWPRATLFICFVAYLSFVAAAQDFSSYQSDGMLLEAGFIALFLAPRGFRPGRGAAMPLSRASLFLLRWEWFRIYFESGVMKLVSGDPQWRHLTAMDNYYQNGPLPTWVGWYVEQLPHWFHVGTAGATLLLELVIVLALFLPRRFKIVCFWIVTPWEAAVILTANYTFLNYLVLALGVLLLDDLYLEPWRERFRPRVPYANTTDISADSTGAFALQKQPAIAPWRLAVKRTDLLLTCFILTWIFYSTTAQLAGMLTPRFPLPSAPVRTLDPFRIANQYGLFAVMTTGRYEIEFQGSDDGGLTWKTYPFRYKPQDIHEAPGIYAPYQPRFDWNLWFASLGGWRDYTFVPLTEVRLLQNSADVLALFKADPFAGQKPPQIVRSVIWQYWFTDLAVKRKTGEWWRRELLGAYAPALERNTAGRIVVVDLPDVTMPSTPPAVP
jgi:hypothetical protein